LLNSISDFQINSYNYTDTFYLKSFATLNSGGIVAQKPRENQLSNSQQKTLNFINFQDDITWRNWPYLY